MNFPAAAHGMTFSEALRKVVLLGMEPEAEDIIDYLVIRVSLLVSVFMAAVTAIWVGRVVGAWAGLLAGIGLYATGIRICALVIVQSHHRR